MSPTPRRRPAPRRPRPAVKGSFHLVVPLWVKPRITSAKLTTVPRQTKVNANFTATGIPAPRLTLNGTLPKGLTFKSGNGTAKLSGTVNAAGTYPLTLTATSSAGSTHKTYTAARDRARARVERRPRSPGTRRRR